MCLIREAGALLAHVRLGSFHAFYPVLQVDHLKPHQSSTGPHRGDWWPQSGLSCHKQEHLGNELCSQDEDEGRKVEQKRVLKAE